MTESKHTLGPWTYDGPPDNIIVWSGPESRVCFMTSDGPAEANAQLISAAPEMLEEGRSLIASLDPDTLNPEQFIAWSALKNACAKATGRQP